MSFVENLNHKVVKKFFERINNYLKVRPFREEQRGEIFNETIFDLRYNYETFFSDL